MDDKSFFELILIKNNKEEISLKSTLESGLVIGLYISAKWGIGCQQFTPKLIENYTKWNAKTKKIEIILLSCDVNDENFEEYFKNMPWLAVKYEQDPLLRQKIKTKYDIVAVPSLIILNKNGEKIFDNAIEEVELYGERAITHFMELY